MKQIKTALIGTPFVGSSLCINKFIEPFKPIPISRQQKRKIERHKLKKFL